MKVFSWKELHAFMVHQSWPWVLRSLFWSPSLIALTLPSIPVVTAKNVQFCQQGGVRLLADIVRPNNDAVLPLVVFIHGGGFSLGTHSGQDDILNYLAQRNYVAAAIDYRLAIPASGPGADPKIVFNPVPQDSSDDYLQVNAKFPAAVNDVKCAINWFRKNKAAYKIDSTKIAVMGASSGGNLALMNGLDSSNGIQAIVDIFGSTDHLAYSDWFYQPRQTIMPLAEAFIPYDFVSMGNQIHTGQTVMHGYLGVGPLDAGWPTPAVALSSPIGLVKAGSPPVLMLHGNLDDTVPLIQSVRLLSKLTAFGVPHRMVTFNGIGHDKNAVLRCGATDIIDFLNHHLKGAPATRMESAFSACLPWNAPGIQFTFSNGNSACAVTGRVPSETNVDSVTYSSMSYSCGGTEDSLSTLKLSLSTGTFNFHNHRNGTDCSGIMKVPAVDQSSYLGRMTCPNGSAYNVTIKGTP